MDKETLAEGSLSVAGPKQTARDVHLNAVHHKRMGVSKIPEAFTKKTLLPLKKEKKNPKQTN